MRGGENENIRHVKLRLQAPSSDFFGHALCQFCQGWSSLCWEDPWRSCWNRSALLMCSNVKVGDFVNCCLPLLWVLLWLVPIFLTAPFTVTRGLLLLSLLMRTRALCQFCFQFLLSSLRSDPCCLSILFTAWCSHDWRVTRALCQFCFHLRIAPRKNDPGPLCSHPWRVTCAVCQFCLLLVALNNEQWAAPCVNFVYICAMQHGRATCALSHFCLLFVALTPEGWPVPCVSFASCLLLSTLKSDLRPLSILFHAYHPQPWTVTYALCQFCLLLDALLFLIAHGGIHAFPFVLGA